METLIQCCERSLVISFFPKPTMWVKYEKEDSENKL
jgi:hypothetical protein